MFREGTPRWSVLAAVLSLPPLVAAPLFVVAHAPLAVALILALALTAGAIFFLRERLPQPTHPKIKRALALALSILVFLAMYSRPFDGLPNWVSSDAGNHAGIVNDLLHGTSSTYGGCLSMHIAWQLIERLFHLNAFWSFVILFYSFLILLVIFPLAIAFIALEKSSGRAFRAGAITAAATIFFGAAVTALPIIHYLQVEGFWTHLFALMPLMLIWWLDVALEVWWQRILLVALGVAAFRYTYGLNLIEVIGAFAILMVLDAPSHLRPWAIIAVLGPLLAGTIALRLFDNMVGMWGWFVAYEVNRALLGGLFALFALAFSAACVPQLYRALRVPFLFCAGSFLITACYRVRLPRSYYVLKYPLLAICVSALAFGIILAVMVARVLERRRILDLALVAVVLGAIIPAVAIWWSTFAGYRQSYWERLVGPPKDLRPLADLEAWRRIDDTLAREKKKFGGYLVSYGPMSNFMNSSMGVAAGQKWYFEGRPPKQDPGYCVFLDASHPDPWPDWNRWYRQRYQVDRLERDKNMQCEDYPARWNSALHRRLCHICK